MDFEVEDAAISADLDNLASESATAHGLMGAWEAPDWPRLTLAEADAVLRRFPAAGGALRMVSYSPRPFSAASVVETPQGNVFVKRHSRLVRDREGLLEEHRFIAHLAGRNGMEDGALAGDRDPDGDRDADLDAELVRPVLADLFGETAIVSGNWTYEVHTLATGVDVYEQSLSWTPFLSAGHARAAGQAMARLHRAAVGYEAPARQARQLVSSFRIFADGDPVRRMEDYLVTRPELARYAEERDWRGSFAELLMPLWRKLERWLKYLPPLWTHNDFHASNLMWSSAEPEASVTGVIDFGLSDRTTAMHDLATAIERNIVEWLRMDEPGAQIVHFDHLDALLAGYTEIAPLRYEEARALAALLPLAHCEFALSETEYFLGVLKSQEKAYLAYEGYFLGHARWFLGEQGERLLAHLERRADGVRSAPAGPL